LVEGAGEIERSYEGVIVEIVTLDWIEWSDMIERVVGDLDVVEMLQFEGEGPNEWLDTADFTVYDACEGEAFWSHGLDVCGSDGLTGTCAEWNRVFVWGAYRHCDSIVVPVWCP
jgi:hypothetical protein